MMTKTTSELVAGDRVKLPGDRVRTVDKVVESAYRNFRNERILYVYYAEGAIDDWSEGNSSNWSGTWELAS